MKLCDNKIKKWTQFIHETVLLLDFCQNDFFFCSRFYVKLLLAKLYTIIIRHTLLIRETIPTLIENNNYRYLLGAQNACCTGGKTICAWYFSSFYVKAIIFFQPTSYHGFKNYGSFFGRFFETWPFFWPFFWNHYNSWKTKNSRRNCVFDNMKKNIFLTSQAPVKLLVFLQCKKSDVEWVFWQLAIITFSSCKPLKLGTTFWKMAAIFKKSSIFLQSLTYFSLFLEIFPSSWKHFFFILPFYIRFSKSKFILDFANLNWELFLVLRGNRSFFCGRFQWNSDQKMMISRVTLE